MEEIVFDTPLTYAPEKNWEFVAQIAQNENLDIKFPAADELFIDIDSEGGMQMFYTAFAIVKERIGIKAYAITPSRSGGVHRHIVVKLNRNVSAMERVALQAVMGSHLTRELLSIINIFNGDPTPSLFLEKKNG